MAFRKLDSFIFGCCLFCLAITLIRITLLKVTVLHRQTNRLGFANLFDALINKSPRLDVGDDLRVEFFPGVEEFSSDLGIKVLHQYADI